MIHHTHKAAMMRSFARRSGVLMVLSVLMYGCGSSGGAGSAGTVATTPTSYFTCPWPSGKQPATASMYFDGLGGVMEVAGNRLSIPKGALTTTTLITLREHQAAEVGVEITAVPAVTFLKDVEVSVNFGPQRCTGGEEPPGSMRLWRFENLGGAGEKLKGGKSGKKVKGKTRKNSHYLIAN